MARRRKQKPTLLEALERWWEEKYNLPSNHELFQSCSLFELLVKFWEDYFYENSLEAHRNPDGSIQLKDTGDPVIDRWEAELASGQSPDFMEIFTEEQKNKIERLRESHRRRQSSRMTIGDTASKIQSQVDELKSSDKSNNKDRFPPTFGSGD